MGLKGRSSDKVKYVFFVQSPKPLEPWDDVFEAKHYGEKCPQLGLLFQEPEGNEDCLFLNVYRPKVSFLAFFYVD